MASAALELMGFFLGLLGMLGTMVATVLPYWQISAHIGSNIVTAVANMRGLWMECVYQSTGAFQCETYNSMLALSSDLQASRALMVISLVLSILAVAMAALGMQCTLCLEGAGVVKSRVAGASGGLFLTAGFLSLIPVSWTTHEVVQTFYRPNVPSSMKFELGELCPC
uniref:Claudin n=1 Tax=Cyclopterus lumpus TaxID=8103 RepID=A0A8C3AR78_CYCLU